MKIIFFSSDMNMIEEWETRHLVKDSLVAYDIETFKMYYRKFDSSIIIADYDSVAHDINILISSNNIPPYLIVLERAPEITTGKMLISHGIKAYGNSRMLSIHYNQMIEAVKNSKVWTYPELTSALVVDTKKEALSKDSIDLIKHRLTNKEQEVVQLIIEGLTNEAIASNLNITIRTVKAHISSIFSKLHVNDRISLVLLLK